jgi:hypothetical protein
VTGGTAADDPSPIELMLHVSFGWHDQRGAKPVLLCGLCRAALGDILTRRADRRLT